MNDINAFPLQSLDRETRYLQDIGMYSPIDGVPVEISQDLQRTGLLVGDPCGRGVQGFVYEVRSDKGGAPCCALKVFWMSQKYDPNRAQHVLKGVEHPSIIGPLKCYHQMVKGEERCVATVYPYVEGSDPMTWNCSEQTREKVERVFYASLVLVRAVQELTRRKIWHNDLHRDNVMITREGVAVIIDFDFATNPDSWKQYQSDPMQHQTQEVFGLIRGFWFSLFVANQELCSPECREQRLQHSPDLECSKAILLREFFDRCQKIDDPEEALQKLEQLCGALVDHPELVSKSAASVEKPVEKLRQVLSVAVDGEPPPPHSSMLQSSLVMLNERCNRAFRSSSWMQPYIHWA